VRSVGLEAGFLADGLRERLQNLLVPQKNGLHVSEFGLDASEPRVELSGQSREICLESRLVGGEAGLGGKEVCHGFLQPSVAGPSRHACPPGSLARPGQAGAEGLCFTAEDTKTVMSDEPGD
jgi:hypothetical protein